MRRVGVGFLVLAAIALGVPNLNAQESLIPERTPPLVLTGAIPLPSVHGRIDHMGFDPKGRLFISVLGNNTEEVVDLSAGIRSHTITGIPKPQGVIYCAELNKLFVGSDEGTLYVYDAKSFDLITSIDFGDDVDNLRHDAASKQLYVGYGDEDDGAIGVVDATTNKRLAREFKLGAHPESFQMERSGPNSYVNVPDLKQIVVINRNTGNISHGRSRLTAIFPWRSISDDLYFDAARKRIYVAGGEGYVNVFQQKDGEHYNPAARIPSAVGARTAGYFGKGRKGFEVFTWPSLHAQMQERRSWSTPYRTNWLAQTVDQATSTRARSQ